MAYIVYIRDLTSILPWCHQCIVYKKCLKLPLNISLTMNNLLHVGSSQSNTFSPFWGEGGGGKFFLKLLLGTSFCTNGTRRYSFHFSKSLIVVYQVLFKLTVVHFS